MATVIDSTQQKRVCQRTAWLSALAACPADRLVAGLAALANGVGYKVVRPTETGLVMVRGRVGGSGTAFNLGEMTVTRCAVSLADGTVGLGYVRGRAPAHAEAAALADALLQRGGTVAEGLAAMLDDERQARQERDRARAVQIQATRVDFSTLVRGAE